MSLRPRSNVLFSIHEALGRPQVLSTTRHITQGGVEVEDLGWDRDRGVLSGRVRVIGGFPMDVTVYVPEGWSLGEVDARGAEVHASPLSQDRTVCLTFRSETTQSVPWTISPLQGAQGPGS